MKPVVRSFSFILCILLLAGCWDRREVNDLAIVVGVGIDNGEKENEIEVSALLVNPSAAGGGSQSPRGGGVGQDNRMLVMSATGLTVADTIAKLQEKVSRKLFWGHTRVIVIGEDMAKKGIEKQVDFFVRDSEARMRAYAFVCKGKAANILEVKPSLETTGAEMLRGLADLKIGASVTIKELMQMFTGDEKAALIPFIEESPLKLDAEGGKGKKDFQVNGTAIFKNGKMVGYIDDKLTRGLLWVRDKVETAIVTTEPNHEEGFVSMVQIRASTKLVPLIKKGKPQMLIKISTEDDIMQNATNLRLTSEEYMKLLEKETEKEVEKYIRLMLEKVQQDMKADVLGFSEAFYREYPDEWEDMRKDWDEIFPNLEVKIDVKAHVRRQGMTSSPSGIPEDEVKKE